MKNRSKESAYLLRAVELARMGLGLTRPNPAVGAVIVKDGKIIGEGWHRKAGADHAEVAAIKDALHRLGSAVRKPFNASTLYVTLEPCSKPGRVGACTDAIIAAGIKRVVYGVADPNPKNRGKAKRALAKGGVTCELFNGDKEVTAKCHDLIAGFRKLVLTGLPLVMVKLAMSMDGKICDDWGEANWISCKSARDQTNKLRSMVDAIMVGAETVRKDNPSLLARIHPNKDLIRVIISRSGKLPKKAQVFTDGKNLTLVFDDAKKALEKLGEMGITSVLCEGGLKLARSLAEAGLVDEWLTVMAPVVIGTKRISQSLRGEPLLKRCGLVHGDSFYQVGFSNQLAK